MAPLIYAVTDASRLYAVDVETGNAQFLADTSQQLTDIAFGPNGGLFGVDLGGELYSVDANYGTATAIGWAGAPLNALAFAPDGTLYGAGSTGLFAINPMTGAGALVADLSDYPSAGDLTFDGAGNLLLATSNGGGMLVRVDTSTGTVTRAGSLGANDVYGLSFGPDGVVYAATYGSRQFLAVNPSTGVTTPLSGYEGDQITKIYGTAFVDEARRVSVSVSAASVNAPASGMGQLNFSVSLSNVTSRPVSFSYSTSDGTATAPTDYLATSGTVTFAPGELTKTISIPVVGKPTPGLSKTLTLNLSNAVNGWLAANTATGTIIETGGGPTVSLSVSGGTFDENGGVATLTATLSAALTSPTTVNLNYSGTAVLNTNFTAAGSIVIPAGATSATIALKGQDDHAITGPLVATVTIANATGAAPWGTTSLSVTELDATSLPSISVSSVIGSDVAGTFRFVVSLSTPLASPVTVDYSTTDGTAVHGLDFSSTSGTLAFAAGQTSQLITVPILGDPAYKPDKTFTVTLSNPVRASIASLSGQGTILNTSPPPKVMIDDLSVAEGGRGTNMAQVTVQLSSRSEFATSVTVQTSDVTARAGKDYGAVRTTVTFLPGETFRTVSIPILGNIKKQGNRTFEADLVSATSATAGRSQGTVTVLDDDGRDKLQKNSLGGRKRPARTPSIVRVHVRKHPTHTHN